MEKTNEKITLKLDGWQTRIIHDFLDVEKKFNVVEIDFGVIKCPASYKVPYEGLSRRDWILYLTDVQMRDVQKHLNLQTPISGINITDGLIKDQSVVFR